MNGGPARCSECKATIVWTATVNGKMQPLDAEPNDDGNVVMTGRFRATDRGALPESRVLTKAEREPSLFADGGPERFMPHHATCPNVEKFRRPKAS